MRRTKFDELATNPMVLPNLISDPKSWFEKDYSISVSSNPIGKAAEFASHLAGETLPFSYINWNQEDYAPKCFNNTTEYDNKAKTSFGKLWQDISGKTARNDRDMYFLNHTGDGQKAALFSNINMNKYSPNYANDYQSGLFQAGEAVAQVIRGVTGFLGIGAGKRQSGDFYLGSKTKNQDPFYLMQDADGDMVRTSESMTDVLKNSAPPVDASGNTVVYFEPGYDEVSEYGSTQTNFIWKQKNVGDTVYDPASKSSYLVPVTTVLDSNKFSYDKNFIECSILDKTSRLLNKGMNGYNSPIDQTLTKFYDGFVFTSRANATIAPTVVPKINSKGEVIGNRYLVPGLDASGKRNGEKMYNQAELCRVWTKTNPFEKMSNSLRYEELIRRERNSVLDRNGNLNIFPSELNVDSNGARKFMFSLENLAWRDSSAQRDLKNCEKGTNGGRIMWFPPYDLRFTDDSTSNITTHHFLGRSEPLYTYNNTERSGTLSFKIVVDHPSILNLLVQKELAKLNDGEVDEILNAFWAGCVKFDVFELARIWNQFSQSDIDYFKAVIGGIKMSKPNNLIKSKVENSNANKTPQISTVNNTNTQVPNPKTKNKSLFFENDVPLDPNKYKNVGDEGIYQTVNVSSFETYFEQYKTLNSPGSDFSNAQTIKKNYEITNHTGIDTIDPGWIDYYNTIGLNGEKYFNNQEGKLYQGFDAQKLAVSNDLSDGYKGYDLVIDLVANASPLNGNNDELLKRRIISVIKWLLIDVMKNSELFFDSNLTKKILINNIDENITSISDSFIIYRKDKVNDPDTITFNISKHNITSIEAIKAITGKGIVAPNGEYYFEMDAPKQDDRSTKTKFCCFDTQESANLYKTGETYSTWRTNNGFNENTIGTISPDNSKSYADVVCSILSIESSYARRVDINVTAKAKAPKPILPIATNDSPVTISTVDLDPLNQNNITKRDIAQKILNGLITECDYFKVLKSDAPIVYNSLKSKLSYFSPSFHSMTPEGLNARLTFLQQCLRPGETINRNVNDTCDASNTAFGKPPICVLRIGDFYNTKIFINNLNISYDPLLWDLNPEGIGVQPMIANVSMSFKYIGGSGLRTYVDELQNALSFNFYGNADVYDPRTYANTNNSERDLINQERSFFDGNALDLVPIIKSGEKFTQTIYNNTLPGDMIGLVTLANQPTIPGGIYDFLIRNSSLYNPSTVYPTYNVVSFSDNFYLRKVDNELTFGISGNTLNGTVAPPTNTQYWTNIEWKNYGEEGFLNNIYADTYVKQINKKYYNTYEVDYSDTFNQLYSTYGDLVVDNFEYNKLVDGKNILLQLLLNKNYNKNIDTTAPLTDVNNLPIQYSGLTMTISGLTSSNTTHPNFYLFETFTKEANNRNYLEFGTWSDDVNPIKLHLYPQEYLYKIGDGIKITDYDYDTARFNPGNLTGGKGKNIISPKSEVGGIYYKDFSFYNDNVKSLLGMLKDEMKAKLKLELSHFWFAKTDNLNVYKQYLTFYESTHRKIFTDYLVEMLDTYFISLSNSLTDKLNDITDKTGKFNTLLTGLSIITNGYDIRSDGLEDNGYEVIPNGKKLSDTASNIFGYEPYNQYKTLSFNSENVIYFHQIFDYYDNLDSTLDDKLKFVSLGNGNYFFKQITNSFPIKDIAKTGYTFNNLLVQSKSLNDNTVITDTETINFDIPTGTTIGVTLNSYLDKNAQPGVTTIGSITDVNTTYSKFYGMSYTFEKLNYELFEFSNKILDVMLNDNFINADFDLDIIINNNLDFKTQITTGTNLSNLFYYSDKKAYENTKINNYSYLTNSGTTNEQIFTINNYNNYSLTVTDELVSSGLPIIGVVEIGSTITLSGLLDMIFLDFFYTIKDEHKVNIINEFKKPANTPTINISADTKTKQKQIDARYIQIQKTLDSIFKIIYTYRDDTKAKIVDLGTMYQTNYDTVKKSVNKIFTGEETTNEISSDLIVVDLVKSNSEDYKLLVKDTNNIKISVKNNYDLFIKNKDKFNIINKNENKQSVVAPTVNTNVTQLSKYEIGQ